MAGQASNSGIREGWAWRGWGTVEEGRTSETDRGRAGRAKLQTGKVARWVTAWPAFLLLRAGEVRHQGTSGQQSWLRLAATTTKHGLRPRLDRSSPGASVLELIGPLGQEALMKLCGLVFGLATTHTCKHLGPPAVASSMGGMAMRRPRPHAHLDPKRALCRRITPLAGFSSSPPGILLASVAVPCSLPTPLPSSLDVRISPALSNQSVSLTSFDVGGHPV